MDCPRLLTQCPGQRDPAEIECSEGQKHSHHIESDVPEERPGRSHEGVQNGDASSHHSGDQHSCAWKTAEQSSEAGTLGTPQCSTPR